MFVKRCYSLKRNKEFRHVYRAGKSVGSRILVLLYVKSRNPNLKIGFSVSKKLGNAVHRNRIKRRLREAVTPLLPELQAGYKLIFIAREAIADESFNRICSTMRYLVHKANLLIDTTVK